MNPSRPGSFRPLPKAAALCALICSLILAAVATPAWSAPGAPRDADGATAPLLLIEGAAAGASIAGTITDKNGTVLSNIGVRLLRVDPGGYVLAETSSSDMDGRYRFSELGAGDYTMEFRPPRESRQFAQWWGGGAGSTYTTPFSLAAEEALSGMDVRLVTAATVSGTVITRRAPR